MRSFNRMRWGGYVAGLALLGLWAAGCGEALDDPEATISKQGAILYGDDVVENQMRVTALYAQEINPETDQWEWFPRPCSAVRLSASGWYLTARHCITEDGEADGALTEPYQIKITDRVDPGPTGSNPPSDVWPVLYVVDSPDPARIDAALLYSPANGSWGPVTQGQLTALYVPIAPTLIGKDLLAMGYGRGLNNQPSSDVELTNPSSGAGYLRSALLRVAGAAVETTRRFAEYSLSANSAGQITNHGDSGGPDFWQIPGDSGTVAARLLTGIHTTSNISTLGTSLAISEPATFQWITSWLGKMYIKRLAGANGSSATYLDVQTNNPAERTPVWTYRLTDTRAQHWTYDPVTRAIRNENGLCLDVQWNGSANGTPVWMWHCTGGSAQRWEFTDTLAIRNVNGKCLDVPSGATKVPLQLWDCRGNANQQWLISGAP
jgi:hypothetical protein